MSEDNKLYYIAKWEEVDARADALRRTMATLARVITVADPDDERYGVFGGANAIVSARMRQMRLDLARLLEYSLLWMSLREVDPDGVLVAGAWSEDAFQLESLLPQELPRDDHMLLEFARRVNPVRAKAMVKSAVEAKKKAVEASEANVQPSPELEEALIAFAVHAILASEARNCTYFYQIEPLVAKKVRETGGEAMERAAKVGLDVTPADLLLKEELAKAELE